VVTADTGVEITLKGQKPHKITAEALLKNGGRVEIAVQ
jgi:hypothetical protein